ncbi:MAG TPA: class I SAM-dependent methyltransferase [bacterium]|nr:class I SAM-dependent methyltransferase [bacterium]
MKPNETGRRYDRIAEWWDAQMVGKTVGIAYLHRAIGLARTHGSALDVGCGVGRLSRLLAEAGLTVTGVDVSAKMIRIAAGRLPGIRFIRADFLTWQRPVEYDLVVAWDSLFHVAPDGQVEATDRLCDAVAPDGILLFTCGGIGGRKGRRGFMNGVEFHYGSLAEPEYLDILKKHCCDCLAAERDQLPYDHLVILARKTAAV